MNNYEIGRLGEDAVAYYLEKMDMKFWIGTIGQLGER